MLKIETEVTTPAETGGGDKIITLRKVVLLQLVTNFQPNLISNLYRRCFHDIVVGSLVFFPRRFRSAAIAICYRLRVPTRDLFFALGVEEVPENNGVDVDVVDVPPNAGRVGAPRAAVEVCPNDNVGASVDASGTAANAGAGGLFPVPPNKVPVLGVPNRPDDGAADGLPPPNIEVVPNKLLPEAGVGAEFPNRLPLGAGENPVP
jgi:hypothetical protein